MSTIEQHIAAIRANLEELSEQHADRPDEWLAIIETEKTVNEIEKTFKENIAFRAETPPKQPNG